MMQYLNNLIRCICNRIYFSIFNNINRNEDDYQIPDNFNQEMKDQASRLFDITSNDAETEKKKEKFASDILSIVTKHRQLVDIYSI